MLAIALLGAMGLKTFVTGRRDESIKRGRFKQKRSEKRKKKRIPDLSKILTREDQLAALPQARFGAAKMAGAHRRRALELHPRGDAAIRR